MIDSSTNAQITSECPAFAKPLLAEVPSLGVPISEVYLMDCVEGMKHYPDKYFDLAVVDPPYGINADIKRADTGKNKHIKQRNYHRGEWDNETPPYEYFLELFRVSKNQIIWGGNYFLDHLPKTSCMLVWDKDNGDNYYADCELAWTSFDTAVRKFKWKWHGFLQQNMANKEDRIHPTQKPVALYDWIFSEYAKEGMKVLDTHLGSGSSRISANKAKINFVAFEVDEVFYNKQNKRYADFTSQLRMF
jgi:site-specific DNA-methyltransferase (adenine-specific)